jgi:hypothetical protein
MVAVHKGQCHRPRYRRSLAFKLLRGSEGVPASGDEEAGLPEVGEVIGAKPIGPTGGMERIADEDDCGHLQACGRGHRAHPATHRTAAYGHAAGRDAKSSGQRRRAGPDCFDANLRWVGSALSSGLPREFDALYHDVELRHRVIDGHQTGLIPSSAGPGCEHEAGGGRSGHRSAARIRTVQIRVLRHGRQTAAPARGATILQVSVPTIVLP